MKDMTKTLDTFNTYYTANHPKKLHIQKDGETISLIDVPQGSNLMIQAKKAQNTWCLQKKPCPDIFHGDLVISIKRLTPGQEGPCRELMEDSPFELILKNSVVVVERIK